MSYLIIGPLNYSKYKTNNKGGIASVTTSLFDYFRKKKVKVDILSTGKKNYKKSENLVYYKRYSLFKIMKLFFVSFKFLYVFDIRSFLLFNFYSLKFNKINFNSYDLLHVHGLQGRIIDVVSHLTSKPIIITVHSYHFFLNKNKFQLKFWNNHLNKIFKKISLITHVSDVDQIKGKNLGFNHYNKSKTIYNPIFLNKVNNKPKNNLNNIFFVGSLDERKQIITLIQSLKFLPKNVKLTICGDGILKKEILRYTSESKRIIYKGYLNQSLLKKEFQKHSVLVVPSLSESFGLVYLEGIDYGLGVIGYDKIIQEFHQLLELNKNQKKFLLPYKGSCPKILSKKILLAINYRKSNQAGKYLKEIKFKIKNKFSINKISNDYIQKYESVK